MLTALPASRSFASTCLAVIIREQYKQNLDQDLMRALPYSHTAYEVLRARCSEVSHSDVYYELKIKYRKAKSLIGIFKSQVEIVFDFRAEIKHSSVNGS